MKRYIPIIIVVLGIIVFVGSILLIKGNKKGEEVEEEETIAEIPFEKRPVASLTPSEDGHWLKLNVLKIPNEYFSLDYELLYKLPDGRTQGVPGTITLKGVSEIERDLLLGSESSGKFRYDEGVENGTLTLRFRDEKGKLAGKLSTEFRLIKDSRDISSSDSKFKFTLSKTPVGFFVVMETFGLPDKIENVQTGPYGVFSSFDSSLPGTVDLAGKVFVWDGGVWNEIKDNKSSDLGIFVGTSD